MKSKPARRRYRNLKLERGSIWYDRQLGGQRYRFDLKTTSWVEAARERDIFERRMDFHAASPRQVAPVLRELAVAYLQTTGRLAHTTQSDYRSYLEKDGPILPILGERAIDAITARDLVAWWDEVVDSAGRSRRTGNNYTNAIAGIFKLAIQRELIEHSPVPAFRARIVDRYRNKRGRAETEATDCNPIEDPSDIEALLRSAKKESIRDFIFVLAMLDGGLRPGEAMGLHWSQIHFGRDENDLRRYLVVDKNKPRGGPVDTTKSGKPRKVGLSRRLRAGLLMLRGPEALVEQPDTLVFGVIDPGNWRRREWHRITVRCRMAGYNPKHLRDTFASQLLSAGFPLEFVQRQLGHADPATTRRHYARWVGEEYEYREPMTLEPGEVPADVLARLRSENPEPGFSAVLRAPG